MLGDEPVDPYAAYGAQAAVVLLDAIERAGGTDRAKIAEEIFNTEVTGGILGDFQIGENGDPEQGSGGVVGFTIYRAEEQLETETCALAQAGDRRRGVGELATLRL